MSKLIKKRRAVSAKYPYDLNHIFYCYTEHLSLGKEPKHLWTLIGRGTRLYFVPVYSSEGKATFTRGGEGKEIYAYRHTEYASFFYPLKEKQDIVKSIKKGKWLSRKDLTQITKNDFFVPKEILVRWMKNEQKTPQQSIEQDAKS